ncbi:Uridine nucleosidase 1 [Neophaeococcomyces mojaviensis]|uniref:Uridine nucleosidase 1 n=1 Tax=Neophaeococcomyces mojaviensis TaxID=3383035 RepID=A0ACC2ZZ57_9EURO|nr:Uridine nucleosidase 1 [Knufia sp. JES_112]
MGGAIGNGFTHVYMGPPYTDSTGHSHTRIGNRTPFAEFNIWCDPEAAKSIFTNTDLKDKIVLIPLDLTHQACANKDVRDTLLHSREKRDHPTRLRRMFYELLMFFAKTYEEVFGLVDGPPLHDPLAVAVLLADQIPFNDNGGERWKVNVITEGEQVGRTEIVAVEDGSGVLIPRSLSLNEFWNTIEDCLHEADKATLFSI